MPENAVAGLDVAGIAASSCSALSPPASSTSLVTLMTPTRTLAAVRAERAGRSVPCAQELSQGEPR
jgi:hypothetical protein